MSPAVAVRVLQVAHHQQVSKGTGAELQEIADQKQKYRMMLRDIDCVNRYSLTLSQLNRCTVAIHIVALYRAQACRCLAKLHEGLYGMIDSGQWQVDMGTTGLLCFVHTAAAAAWCGLPASCTNPRTSNAVMHAWCLVRSAVLLVDTGTAGWAVRYANSGWHSLVQRHRQSEATKMWVTANAAAGAGSMTGPAAAAAGRGGTAALKGTDGVVGFLLFPAIERQLARDPDGGRSTLQQLQELLATRQPFSLHGLEMEGLGDTTVTLVFRCAQHGALTGRGARGSGGARCGSYRICWRFGSHSCCMVPTSCAQGGGSG